MIATIMSWELRRRRWYLLWWCIGVTALVVMLMLVYPSIHREAAQLDQVYSQLPNGVRGLRGGEGSITSPIGYLNGELFYITLPLLLIIMSIGLGSGLLSKDEQDRTLELVLARPVGRGQVLLAKALSGLTLAAVVGGIATASTAIMARMVNMDIATGYVLLAGVAATVFAAAFGALAFSLSAASLLSRRMGITVAIVASFGGYLLESLSALSDKLELPAKLLPYHYYVPKDILAGKVSRGFVVYMLGIFVVCGAVAYLGFRRRDLS